MCSFAAATGLLLLFLTLVWTTTNTAPVIVEKNDGEWSAVFWNLTKIWTSEIKEPEEYFPVDEGFIDMRPPKPIQSPTVVKKAPAKSAAVKTTAIKSAAVKPAAVKSDVKNIPAQNLTAAKPAVRKLLSFEQENDVKIRRLSHRSLDMPVRNRFLHAVQNFLSSLSDSHLIEGQTDNGRNSKTFVYNGRPHKHRRKRSATLKTNDGTSTTTVQTEISSAKLKPIEKGNKEVTSLITVPLTSIKPSSHLVTNDISGHRTSSMIAENTKLITETESDSVEDFSTENISGAPDKSYSKQTNGPSTKSASLISSHKTTLKRAITDIPSTVPTGLNTDKTTLLSNSPFTVTNAAGKPKTTTTTTTPAIPTFPNHPTHKPKTTKPTSGPCKNPGIFPHDEGSGVGSEECDENSTENDILPMKIIDDSI